MKMETNNTRLTDDEVVKALECCIDTTAVNCGECPYCEDCVSDENTSHIMTDALDLINRLQSEKENYKQIAENQQSVSMDKEVEIKRLRAEVERLKATVDSFTDIGKLYSEIKAEAVKEFAERLKGKMLGKYCMHFDFEITNAIIDNLLKEMVGE